MDAAAQRKLYLALDERRGGHPASVELPGADLRGAQLTGADLVGAELVAARLDFATLAGARLSNARLNSASLTGSDLGGTDLSGADLRAADLSEVRLDATVLTDADLRGASLRDAKGQPLSWSGARIDAAFIERSGLSERDVGRMVRLGALVEPGELDSMPPSARPSSGVHARTLESLRVSERNARRAFAEQDREMPVSRRWADELQTLLTEGRTESAAVPSLRAPLPFFDPSVHGDFVLPSIGDTVLGVRVEEEVEGGATSRCYLGRNDAGDRLVLRIFDPARYGAALQLPAFQHGLETAAGLAKESPLKGFAEVVCVGTDLTAYVTRFYPNGSLLDLAGVNLTLKEKVRLIRGVCEAVAAAHEAGVLIRCLKPSTVLLDGLEPVLAEVDLVDLPALASHSGDVAGYGPFAAPEELLGQGTRSPTADVFSLGRLLHFLLRGSVPDGPVEAHPTLSDLASVPRGLVEVVRRATAADPGDRYQYVEALLRDLNDYGRLAAGAAGHSLRPLALSRLSLRPLSESDAPPRPEPKQAPRQPVINVAPQKALDQPASFMVRVAQEFLERRTELILAGTGLVVACALVGAIVGVDLPANSIQTFATLIALALGLASWLAPRPHRKVTPLRLSSFAAVALLVSLADPGRLVVLRWKQQLSSGDAEARSRAVPLLAREGYRDFAGKNLDGVSLVSVDLGQVSFEGASMKEANLMGAMLMEANFKGADLTGALLLGADLRGAELEEAANIEAARCDKWTGLPRAYECFDGKLRKAGASQ